MNDIQEILKRYYRGETSIEEERRLRNEWHNHALPTEPSLAYRGNETPLPAGLLNRIEAGIEKRKKNQQRRIIILSASIAAALVLLIGLRTFLPAPMPPGLRLSDNTKRQRFEDAMRVIGNTLDEKPTRHEKILYEDNHLIISIE